jgi:small redox-active disulfide protein 2
VKVQVLGPGCPKCEKTFKIIEEAAKELGLDPDIEKVTRVDEIMKFGVMLTPAVVVDGEVKAVGKVPSIAQAKRILSPAE